MLKVANRTLELLEFICTSPKKEFTVSELSRAFQTDKASIYRMLRVLTERGYLRQDKKAGSYMLGLKLLELGAQTTEKIGLLDIVLPFMERLSLEIQETINLGVMNETKVVYIHKIESPHFLRTDLRVGTTVPSYSTGLGKAMLAFYSRRDLEEMFKAEELVLHTNKTICNMGSLIKELEQIKEKGYAVDNEEYLPGIVCIAAPLLDRHNKAIAAISVAGPIVRLENKQIDQVGKKLRDIALEISHSFGCPVEK